MRGRKNTIEAVLKEELCTGCGTCVGMCPESAIEMVVNEAEGIYVPRLIDDKCNLCGICFDVCPGHSLDFTRLNLEIFGREPQNALTGNYINYYLAHATDNEIRYNSASGGLVTSLLIFALEQGMINGALVTRMREGSVLEPEVFIARSKEEIVSASTSKYCPVPANIGLRQILREKGKYAVVGLPCHTYGVRRAEEVNEELKAKIALHLGLFCSHTVNFKGTEFLLYKMGIERKDVAQIFYRGKGWPGEIRIKLIDGDERIVPQFSPLFDNLYNYLFTPRRCLFCNDALNELADISFGDAWLPEIMAKEHIGESIVITRSEQGEALLQAAKSEGKVDMMNLDRKVLLWSQRASLHFKKVNLKDRIQFCHLLGRKAPSVAGGKTSLYSKFVAIFPLVCVYLGSKPRFVSIIKYMPVKLISLCDIAFSILYGVVVRMDFRKLLH